MPGERTQALKAVPFFTQMSDQELDVIRSVAVEKSYPKHAVVLTEGEIGIINALPVLIMLNAWGTKHRGGDDLTRYVDTETGKPIVPIAVDLETGARIGTRPIRTIDGKSGAELAPPPVDLLS